MKSFSVAGILFFIGIGLHAAPLERDLGQGLAYQRAAVLPADLPAEKKSPPALVLDLRYASGGEAAAIALGAWLDFHKNNRTFLAILANEETAAPLRRMIDAHRENERILTLGPAAPGFAADLILPIQPTDERAAYDALAKGTDVQALIQPKVEKYRYDEASLASHQPAASPEDEDELLDDQPAEKTVKAAPPAPPFDAVLQRAVQVHRSLLALQKSSLPKA